MEKKRIAKDLIYCIAAVGMMNAVLQLIVYPIINNRVGETGFGQMLFMLGILNILAPSFGQGVGNAKPDDRCECGVNGGRAHHIGVVAGGADGKTEPGFQEEAEEDAHKHDRDDRDGELILSGKGGAREQVFHVGKDARRLIHIENRRAAHDGDIHRVERSVDDDAREQAVDAHFRLQHGGHEP